jgi:parallel beta-helix repeat protein
VQNSINLTIRDCWIHDVRRDGLDLDVVNIGTLISGNRIYDCDGYGIHLYGGLDSIITKNTLTGNGVGWAGSAQTGARPAAIDIISGSERVVFSDNIIRGQREKCIQNTGDFVTITGNIIEDYDGVAGLTAAIDSTGNDCIISNNTLSDINTNGIHLSSAQADRTVIANNQISGIASGFASIKAVAGLDGLVLGNNSLFGGVLDLASPPFMPSEVTNYFRGLFGEEFDGNMILEYDTTLATGLGIEIPLFGSATDCLIDWGDGSSETATGAGNVTHTYSKDGTYRVTISGFVFSFGYQNASPASSDTSDKLTRVISFGQLGIISFHGAFRDSANLLTVPEKAFPTSVLNIGYMFRGCTLFNSDIGAWDVRYVTGFGNVFQGCDTLDGANIGNWSVRVATSPFNMFNSADVFSSNLGNWDIRSFTGSMSGMFQNSGMNTVDYSNTLIGWANTVDIFNAPLTKSLGTNTLTYNSTASAAVTILTTAGWTNLGSLV